MPIYAYKCESCGHRQDVLQKISDPRLTDCPACGASTYVKQVTAAGFQLKGSGWYVTDFRDGGSNKDKGGAAADKPAHKSADKPAEGSAEKSAPAASSESGAGAAAPAVAPAPAPAASSSTPAAS
jgi:putative FmdB family regulatory protein